jgi:hypothetical protein
MGINILNEVTFFFIDVDSQKDSSLLLKQFIFSGYRFCFQQFFKFNLIHIYSNFKLS